MSGSERAPRRAKRALAKVAASVAACLALCALLPPGALAQGPDPAAAEALFKAGMAAAHAGDLELACTRFRESQHLEPAPGTLYNLADCEEKRGKLATAWALFGELSHTLPPQDERVAMVRGRVGALEPRLPKLIVRLAPGAPASTTVRRDDVALGPGSLGVQLPVDPGRHVVTATAPGRSARTYEIVIAESASKEVSVAPAADASSGTPQTPGPSPTDTAPGSGQRLVGLVVGGAGVVAMGAGAVLGLVAKSRYDGASHCAGELCDAAGIETRESARRLGTAGTVVFVVGAAALAGGVVLWLTAPTAHGQGATRLAVGPRGAWFVSAW
jgi:hypothetical protein